MRLLTAADYLREIGALDAMIQREHKFIDANPDDHAASLQMAGLIHRRTELSRELQELGDDRLPGQSLDLIFTGGPVHDHQVESDFAGRILRSVQGLLRSIVGSSRNPQATSRRFSADIRATSRLMLADVFPGSFGMRLEAISEQSELDGMSLMASDVEKMVELIGSGDQESELLSRIAAVGPLGAKSYEEVLQNISSSKATVSFRWPRAEGVREVVLRPSEARNALAVLKDVEEDSDGHFYTGLLDTASRRRGRFGFTTDEGDTFDGEVEQSIMDTLRDYYDRRCRAYILTRTVRHKRTSATHKFHRLQELSDVETPQL